METYTTYWSIHPDVIAGRDGISRTAGADAEGQIRKRNSGIGMQRHISYTLNAGPPPGIAMETYTTYTYDGLNQRYYKEVSVALRIGRDSSDHITRMKEPKMESDHHQPSMFSLEDSPARTTRLQDSAEDWLATVAHSGGNITGSLLISSPSGLSEKMSLGSSLVEAAQTLRRSSGRSPNAGMAWPGRYLTLNTSEWRNAAAACSLSDILEESPDPKYSLSPKACTGILRRAEKRGRALPPALQQALKKAANTIM